LLCCGGVWKALPEEVSEKHSSLPALEDAALNLSDALMKTDYRDNVSFVMIET
jgi:serine/threonine protein phosphatase PrpC